MRTPSAPVVVAAVVAVAAVITAPACTHGVEGEGEGDAGEGEGDVGEGEGEGEGDVGAVTPPLHASSHGSGGPAAGGDRSTSDGVDYIIVPAASPTTPAPLMIVYSGVEGGAQMAANLQQAAPPFGLGDVTFAVLDGAVFFGDGAAGASVLDDMRALYDVDNDRTYLLSESAGTSAGLELGFQLRQSFFAAYWANDVNATLAPSQNAAALGFAPFGNAGPGGDFGDADTIVNAMRTAGYRVEDPAPYDGAGANSHGDPNQFIAALQWFVGRSRN